MRAFPAAAVALVLPVTAAGQPPSGVTEFAALAGASLLEAGTDDGTPGRPVPPGTAVRRSIGGSVLLGLRAARRLGERARVGVSFAVAPSHDLTSQAPLPCEAPICPMPPPTSTERSRLVAYHYGLSVAYDLARGRARPFLGLGAGGVSYAGGGEVKMDLAMRVEGGIKVYWGRFGFELQAGDAIVPSHFLTGKTEHDVHLAAGVLFRLP